MTSVGRARRLGVAALAAVVTLVAAGCSGLPRSSDVRPGLRVDANVGQRARVVVSAPIKGAPPQVIASDFIRAGASFQETDDTHQVVGRAYLAPTSVDRWKPTSAITVYDAPTGLSIEQLPADQLRLTVDAVATIDATGHYAELPPGTKRSVIFSMTRVDGEWRIDLPEQGFGIWLNTDDIDRVFSPYSIHYVVPGTRRLVSDVRWFPSGPGVPTALARAQLGAVPDYLEGVAQTEVPSTTALAVDAVDVDAAGTATVTLTNTAQTVDPDRRRAMWAQFVATLIQAPSVTTVSLQVQGIGPIPVPNLPDAIPDLTTLGYEEEQALALTMGAVRRGDKVERVDPQGIGGDTELPAGTPLPGTAGPVTVADAYTGLALSADGTDLAAVAESRRELVRWRGGVPITLPSLGSDLTDPAYESGGRLWVAGLVGSVARVWTVDATTAAAGTPTPVRVDWLAGRRVVALRVSPDGTRAAVVSRKPDGSDSRLDVAGIRRDATGVAVSLASPYRQAQPLVDLRSVVWTGPLDLAVLARAQAKDPLRPFAVSLGGGVGLRRVGRLTQEQLLIGPVAGARSLTTRGGVRGLLGLTGTTTLLRVGNTWAPLEGVRDVVVGGL